MKQIDFSTKNIVSSPMKAKNVGFKDALAYVKQALDAELIEEVKTKLGNSNMELIDVNEELADEIHDLMEEYGDRNNLPEGWWEYEGTTEDILWKL